MILCDPAARRAVAGASGSHKLIRRTPEPAEERIPTVFQRRQPASIFTVYCIICRGIGDSANNTASLLRCRVRVSRPYTHREG